ncbi:hypothetical protein [Algoriphagus confluentis]
MKKSLIVILFLWMMVVYLPGRGHAFHFPLRGQSRPAIDTAVFQIPDIPVDFDILGVPESWAQKYPQELLKLSFFLKSKSKPASLLSWTEASQENNRALVYLGETFPKDSLLGNQRFVPFASQGRWVYLKASGDTTQKVHYFFQSGGSFQAGDFAKEMGLATIGESYSQEEYDYQWKKSYPLSELDFPKLSLSANNSPFNKTLPTYLTKGFFKDWKVNLHFTVSNEESTEAYLNFLVNNNLIRTFQVKKEGAYHVEFSIPPMPLSVGSYLTLELVNGNGNSSLSSVIVDLDVEKSQISPSFRNEFPMTFSSFPKNMEGKPLKILIDYELPPAELEALADLILLINQRPDQAYPFYFPELIRVEPTGKLPEIEANFILITRSPQAYLPLVKNQSKLKYTEQGRDFQSDELDKFFQYHSREGLSSMELLALESHRILFIANDPKESQSMKEAVDGLEDEIISNTGNILLADAKHYYFFDIRLKEPTQVGAEKQAQFEQFWKKSRIYITILLMLGLVFLLRYIYFKSQHAKKSIEDARN